MLQALNNPILTESDRSSRYHNLNVAPRPSDAIERPYPSAKGYRTPTTSTVSTDTNSFSRALAHVLLPKRRPEIPWEYDVCHPNDIFTRDIIPDENKIWPYGPNGRKRANTMALTSESMTRVALREKLEIERFITSQLASAHSRIQKKCRALSEDNSQLHGVIDGYEAQIQGYEAQMQVYEAELERMRFEREDLIDNFRKPPRSSMPLLTTALRLLPSVIPSQRRCLLGCAVRRWW